MKIVTWDRQAEINESVQRWIETNQRWMTSGHARIPAYVPQRLAALQALGPNPTAEEFSAAIGADTPFAFPMPTCDECKQPVAVRVELGAGECEDCGGKVAVCLDCIVFALSDLGKAVRNG